MKKQTKLISLILKIVTVIIMAPISAFAAYKPYDGYLKGERTNTDSLRSDDFQYVTYISEDAEEYVTVVRYLGDETDVIIPSQINGLPVKEIYERTFLRKKQIESIVIPETVEFICCVTFRDCPKLENITV